MKYFNTVRQKLRRKIVILPRLLSKIFRDQKLVKHQKIPLRNFSALRQKIFDGKSWYTPPSFIQIFSRPEVSETLKDSPTKFFGTVRQKIFDRKSWNSPPPLLSINFFATGRFQKHSTEGFTYQFYRHCETKNFRRKNVIPPSMHKIFWYPKFSETSKGRPRKLSALWDKNFSTEKRDTP